MSAPCVSLSLDDFTALVSAAPSELRAALRISVSIDHGVSPLDLNRAAILESGHAMLRAAADAPRWRFDGSSAERQP
jgi:hypothetical protein